jgi:hypothetical protein
MPANMWRRWLNRASQTLASESRRAGAHRRRLPAVLRLEELESRLTPAVTSTAAVTFLNVPNFGVAGQPLSPAVQVSVMGQEGKFSFPITNDSVTLNVAAGPTGFSPAGPSPTATTDQNGIATFSNLALDVAGSYSFVASETQFGQTSAPSSNVGINPGPASQLIVSASAPEVQEGAPVAFAVLGLDQFGNPATGSTIHFSSSTTEASLPPDYTFQPGDGGVYFFETTFTAAGTQTITANVLNSTVSDAVGVAVQPASPDNIQVNVSASDIPINQPVTLSGSFTDPGTLDANTVVVAWGDGSANTTLVLPAQVRSFNAVHSYTDEGDYFPTVFITNSDGGTGENASEVQVLPGSIDNVADTQGLPGQTVTSSITDAQSNSFSATLSLSPSDATGGGILVAKLSNANLPSRTNRAGLLSIYDIRVTSPKAGDSALVSFRFRVGADIGLLPTLQFLDTKTGALELFIPSGKPDSFELTRQGDFIVGKLLLDGSSTPTLQQLTRTVFTISVNVPSSAATATVSASVASADPAATAPASTATFRTTSQLTLTLEPTQAGQVSGGLSSFNAANTGGGGETTPEDAAAAGLVSFLAEEVQGRIQALWPFGDPALGAWIQQFGHTSPDATLPLSADPGSVAPGTAPPVQREDESLRDASEYLFRELASTLNPPLGDAPASASPHPESRQPARGAVASQGLLSSTTAGRVAFLAGLAVAFPERRKQAERNKPVMDAL